MLSFAVHRRDPELVGPASQTPRETKRMSGLDNMDVLRMQASLALFYRGGEGDDPAAIIRRALGEALVHYYPLAGRLREIEGRKLVVDCTGEGVLFVQADADVQLADLEAAGLRPPFPCWDQLLFDVEGSSGTLNCPLLLIQVTRLLCGGFVLALRCNHVMCDAIGIAQFMNAVSELARGLPSISVKPVWCRELIEMRNPSNPGTLPDIPEVPMVERSFTVRASDVAAMKKCLPPLLRDTATTFEILAAFLWRARTTALDIPPGEHAPLVIAVNFRGDAGAGISLPAGYYGNAVATTTVPADAAVLRRGSLGDAVALVRLAKAAGTTEYFRSMANGTKVRGLRSFNPANLLAISDTRNIGFHRVDFGWGEPIFAGPVSTFFTMCYFIRIKDRDGEDAFVMPLMLPRLAMDRFAAEVERSLFDDANHM
ncbi:hypothetical protein QYE76_012056 [Lolium multiflorum]|uniref:Uncharacterized protein n=1 Tax=Lolium multiflorum TaxID=4521 RepID=A0AAD8X676_LOLMU|nr:hypothetical protein QYE76_012056 [Lolium multiflorum]